VFVSSTFRDMGDEREILAKKVRERERERESVCVCVF